MKKSTKTTEENFEIREDEIGKFSVTPNYTEFSYFILVTALNRYGIHITGICRIRYLRCRNALYHLTIKANDKVTAYLCLMCICQILKIISVGHCCCPWIRSIVNCNIFYAFNGNLRSGVFIGSQQLHINIGSPFFLPLLRTAS